MAARVCTACEISYPSTGDDYMTCRVCGSRTAFSPHSSPGTNWEAQVRAACGEPVDVNERDREVGWRVGRLLDAGLPWDIATVLASRRGNTASGWQVDVAELELLVERGATPLQAARILG